MKVEKKQKQPLWRDLSLWILRVLIRQEQKYLLTQTQAQAAAACGADRQAGPPNPDQGIHHRHPSIIIVFNNGANDGLTSDNIGVI